MTKPLTSTSVADALAECYKNSGHWGSRRETFSIRDGPLEKLWGRGGGIFEPQEFFFVIKFLEGILAWKSFGVNGRAWIFFIWSPLERIFFCTSPPPPTPLGFLMVRPLCHWDKMDLETLQNWLPGLTRYRLKIARHHWILHGWGSVVSAVSSRRMYFFLFWKLCYFKCTNQKDVNYVCFNSRKWHLAR